MENQKQVDDRLLAVMEFIHHYDAQVSLSNLLNGTSFYKLIMYISSNSQEFDFNIKINDKAVKWSDRLQNLQAILYKIQQYFENVHQKSLQINNIDLIDLVKSQELKQVINYFEIVMVLLMESTCKQNFVQTIMMLQQSSQEIFVQIIKNSLDGHRFTKSKYKLNNMDKLIHQFNVEKVEMQKQIERLCEANLELLHKISEYEETINQIQLDNSLKKASLQSSIDQGSNIKYLEEYIDKLQNKIVEQAKRYQEEKLNFQEKIMQMQQQLEKLQQAEQLSKIYKQKYDDIMDQMQKMNIWKRQKAKMQKLLQEKDFMVQKLQDRLDELTQKNLILQQNELQLKMELQKKQIRIQKISSQLKKVMENMGQTGSSFSGKICQASFLDQSLKECMMMNNAKSSVQDSLYASQDQITQLKKQNQKLLKKNKQQQKQICKLSKKLQRLRILQQDKIKLQQLVFHMRIVQSQQLNLMFSVFYEGFEQNVQMSKKLKHEILNCKSTQQIIPKVERLRKKKTTLIKLGKQNWKQSY